MSVCTCFYDGARNVTEDCDQHGGDIYQVSERGDKQDRMNDTLRAEQMVAFLNSILKVDQRGISRLMFNYVEINEELANHYSIQTHTVGLPEIEHIVYKCGTLGLLNGFIGIKEDGMGYIVAIANTQGGERIIDRFEVSPPTDSNRGSEPPWFAYSEATEEEWEQHQKEVQQKEGLIHDDIR